MHYRVLDLGHTALSSLLVAGIPLAEVSQLAGHAGPRITAALYAHVVKRSWLPTTAQLARFHREEGVASAEPPSVALVDEAAGEIALP